jgi:hypothetical protein
MHSRNLLRDPGRVTNAQLVQLGARNGRNRHRHVLKILLGLLSRHNHLIEARRAFVGVLGRLRDRRVDNDSRSDNRRNAKHHS